MPYIVDRGKLIPINPSTKYNYKKSSSYPSNDLMSVYVHYDYKLKRNVPTENKINGGIDNNDPEN